jgi:thioredoxin reductase (NADPH)
LLEASPGQAARYGAVLEPGEIESLKPAENGFRARLDARPIAARKVLLATGIVDEKPALPSLPEFIYRGGMRLCPICDGYEAMDKRIAVIGPLQKAIRKALFLRTLYGASKVKCQFHSASKVKCQFHSLSSSKFLCSIWRPFLRPDP